MTYLRLQRATGPACPRCGCTDSEILQRPPEAATAQQPFAIADPQKAAAWARSSWWQSGKARCNHCRNVFVFQEMPASPPEVADQVIEQESQPAEPSRKATECPKCGGPFHVYKTRGQVQYRKCKNPDCKNTEGGKTSVPTLTPVGTQPTSRP